MSVINHTRNAHARKGIVVLLSASASEPSCVYHIIMWAYVCLLITAESVNAHTHTLLFLCMCIWLICASAPTASTVHFGWAADASRTRTHSSSDDFIACNQCCVCSANDVWGHQDHRAHTQHRVDGCPRDDECAVNVWMHRCAKVYLYMERLRHCACTAYSGNQFKVIIIWLRCYLLHCAGFICPIWNLFGHYQLWSRFWRTYICDHSVSSNY